MCQGLAPNEGDVGVVSKERKRWDAKHTGDARFSNIRCLIPGNEGDSIPGFARRCGFEGF